MNTLRILYLLLVGWGAGQILLGLWMLLPLGPLLAGYWMGRREREKIVKGWKR